MRKRKFDEGGSVGVTPDEPTGPGSLTPGGFYPMPGFGSPETGGGGGLQRGDSARSGLNQINQGASAVDSALNEVSGSLQQAASALGSGNSGMSSYPGPFARAIGPAPGDMMARLQKMGIGTEMKKGGKVKGYAKGGSVKSASSRGDGIAQRGKTKGRMV
jgi:hypothetical protein